jgi:ribosomal protein S18 acetylase RimI-like enzyme
MNKVHLKKVTRHREILETSGIAHVVWREHYNGIISNEQVEYMLSRFQSPDAISKAVSEGYEYYIIRRLGVSAGYLAIKPGEPAGEMFLSKIYLLKDYRGKGYAYDAISQLEEKCRRQRLSSIWLTVNKGNPSVDTYKKIGFEISEEKVTDIGSGYVMDDYIMVKKVV